MKQQYTFSRIFSFLPILLAAFLWLIGTSVWGQLPFSSNTPQTGTTITVPAGVTCIQVEAWGAGGGGGGGTGTNNSGGGGGGGCYTISIVAVTPGETLTINVGQGGAGGSSGSLDGSDGNPSSVSGTFGTVTALGGEGGDDGSADGSTNGNGCGGGGNGGAAGGGTGGAGGAGENGGAGASSPGNNGAGIAGTAPGGGGSGGSDGNANGGQGGAGQVIITSASATIALTSGAGTDNQNVCQGSAITDITYGTTNAAGASASGLPSGVSGSFSGGTFTISGTPTVSGIFNYTVTTTAPCSPVVANGTITVTSNQIANAGADQIPGDCSTSTTLAGNAITDGGSGTWTVSPAGPTITAPSSPTSTVTGMTAGTEYTFTWTSTNGACSNSDQMVFNSVGPGCVTYCTPGLSSNCGTLYGEIYNVTFNTINNSTTGEAAYEDFSGTSTTVAEGTTVNISIDARTVVTGGGCNSPEVTCLGVFIDWNADGDFNDADEYVDLGTVGCCAVQTITSTINVPCGATTGANLLMRIVLNNVDCTDPCVPSGIGQVEDYTVVVTAEPVVTADAGPDQIISCTSSTTLDATGSSITNGYWELVSGSGTFTSSTSQTTTVSGLSNGANVFEWNAIGNCGSDAATVTINVSGLPNTPITAGNDIASCDAVIAINGSDPAPGTGLWTYSPIDGSSFDVPTSGSTNFNPASNTTYTLTWTVTVAGCPPYSDDLAVIAGSLPTAEAGPNQTVCPSAAIMDADAYVGLTGTWSIFDDDGTGTGGFVDVNDPNSIAYNLTGGPNTYVMQWCLTGGNCPGSSCDQVTIQVDNCVTNITHDPNDDQTFYGCSYTYTDDGGAGGNYSDGVNQTWTTFCPDDPNAFAEITVTAAFLGPGDYMVVYDDNGPGAPIVGGYFYDSGNPSGPIANPSLGTTITSSTGCLYIQMNSTASFNYSGWQADISCSNTAGAQNTDFITINNCGGGGGITLCESGNIPTTSNQDTNPPDLGGANSGCLGSQEGASNTWVYMQAESDGWIAFEIDPAGGQDFDYAMWGPYDGGYACPGMTLDDPIRCTWAANGGSSCDAVIGLGTFNTSGNAVLASDVSEGGYCDPSVNEGWTYPVWANTGDVYVLLFQNYGFNNSSFEFTINDPAVNDIPAGGSFASLGCDPVTALPIQLISFVGEHRRGVNHLYWNTASEYRNDYFIIEKSSNGMDWVELTTVDGAGFSGDLRHYSTKDVDPYDEVTYYRLLQVDMDGHKRKYKTISLATEYELDGLFSYIYPNPSNGNVYFNYGGKNFNEPIIVAVYNGLGQLVNEFSVEEFNGAQGIEIDATDYSEGIYNVQISQGDHVEVKRVSIIR